MTTRRSLALALVVGLMSCTACTAEKTETKNQEVQAVKLAPKLVDGIFATDDHLQPVYFDLNKAKLTDSAMETVKTNAEWLKMQPPYLIRLLGYADSRGSLKKNERLAARRADALSEAYIAMGISKDRLSVMTRGTEEPACQPVTEDCLAKSRRTETLLEDKSLASR